MSLKWVIAIVQNINANSERILKRVGNDFWNLSLSLSLSLLLQKSSHTEKNKV
jgi:hypothetical protein